MLYASLARTASQCISMHWPDTKSHYFWKQEIFLYVRIGLFPAALQKKYSGKILRNDTNEKGVLLTYMPNVKPPVSSRTWIRFLQMTIFAELSFCFRQARFLMPRGEPCLHSSKTLNNLPTLSPSSVCSSKVGLSVYKSRLGHKSPFITLQSRLSCPLRGEGFLTVPERRHDRIKLGTRVSKTGIK